MNRIAWAVCLTVSAGCAGRIPLPDHLRVAGPEELIERMERARSPVQSFVAEARTTYFGPEGRLKGTVVLAAARPASMRYDVLGPQGTPIEAFATDGQQMQWMNVSEEIFVRGPATVENVDRLIGFAPLRLDPAGWVSILFGELTPPASAALRYDDEVGRFVLSWPEPRGGRVEVEVDPASSRITAAQVSQGETVISEVEVEERDSAGLPVALHMRAPTRDIDVRVRLREVEHDPGTLGPAQFALQPPRGFAIEELAGEDEPPEVSP